VDSETQGHCLQDFQACKSFAGVSQQALRRLCVRCAQSALITKALYTSVRTSFALFIAEFFAFALDTCCLVCSDNVWQLNQHVAKGCKLLRYAAL
jgi:hypothetical protein